MYFPIGWPKVLKPIGADNQIIRQIVSNRDKILFASLTDDSLTVWFCKVGQFGWFGTNTLSANKSTAVYQQ